jgi:hypothetical protein
MLNRRSFIGGLSASLPLLALPGSLRAQGAARLHAMIIGINLYTGRGGDGRPIRALRGCQNDAADIERQVRRFQPATLVRLGWDAASAQERPVTRALFLGTWEQVLGAASSGDRLLLTFAGHGSRIPVLPGNPSGETDGMDETLVLTGYDASQGRGAEHIIDDELDVLFRAANAKGVIVCFISDSCHSGTLTRSVDALASDKTYRFVPPGRDAPPVSSPGKPPPILPNLVFIAGAQEDETVPEIRDPATSQYRGALSLAVAQALAGEAVTDGAVTVRSLTTFVRRQVRHLAEGVQNTDIIFPTVVTEKGQGGIVDNTTQLFVLRGAPQPDATTASVKGPTTTPVSTPKVRLRILGRSAADAQRIVSALRNAVLPGPGEAEALVWDAERRLVLNNQGDRVAENVGESDLQSVVDCRLALDELIRQAANGLDVQVLIGGEETRASDAVHKPGDKLTIKVSGLADGDYLTVFNLSGRGIVEMIEPTPYHVSNPGRPDFKRPHFTTGRPVYSTEVSLGDVFVGEPFGADHVVAIAGAQPLRQLMAALPGAHKQHEIPAVMTALARERSTQPLKIGLRGIYTWRS